MARRFIRSYTGYKTIINRLYCTYEFPVLSDLAMPPFYSTRGTLSAKANCHQLGGLRLGIDPRAQARTGFIEDILVFYNAFT
jgi:hypothetical protein